MKKYDVKEALTKPVVTETVEADGSIDNAADKTKEGNAPRKEAKRPETAYKSKSRPVKRDVTFIVIGIILTIAIPLAAMYFFDLTKTGLILLAICVGLLDLLCFLAHRLMNKRIEV